MNIGEVLFMLPFIIILLLPIIIPLIQKKWNMFSVTLGGYLLYIFWGVYLHLTADITEFGTGYGMMIIPYIIVVTLIGVYVQKSTEKEK